MKTIYQKIALVLALGFFAQIISFGIFYKHVIANRVLSEINYQENKRQSIMQDAIDTVQKFHKKSDRLEKAMTQISKKYNVNFAVKEVDGNIIFSSKQPKKPSSSIEKEGYVKLSGQVSYIIYGYFPERIDSGKFGISGQTIRILAAGIIVFISIVILVMIYIFITNPLKKLSRAVKNVQYGNTLVQIPYYGDDELGLLCRNFEEMGERLKKSEDNQQELIQVISHDVKTPLTSIIGYSKRLIEGKAKDEKKIEYHEIIYKKAIDLKLLLEELEDYSKINAGNKYKKELINCSEIFKKLSLELKTEVENKGSIFNYLDMIDKNLVVNIDVNKITRVFMNLVHNSLKYAGDKCIINVTGISDDKKLRFEINDNGEGVPEESLNKIFDRFYRVDSSRSREKGGTGLGLAICKDIVENHGGEIRAVNLDHGGFSIIVEFKIW